MPRKIENGRLILHDRVQIDLGTAAGYAWDMTGLDEVTIQTAMPADASWPTSTVEVQISNDGNDYYGFDDTVPTPGTAVTLTAKGLTETLNVTPINWLRVVPTTLASAVGNLAEIIIHGEGFPRGV